MMDLIRLLLANSLALWQFIALVGWTLPISFVFFTILFDRYGWRIERKLRRFPWHKRMFLIKCFRKLNALAFRTECKADRLLFWGRIEITFPQILCKLLRWIAESARKVEKVLYQHIRSLETNDC